MNGVIGQGVKFFKYEVTSDDSGAGARGILEEAFRPLEDGHNAEPVLGSRTKALELYASGRRQSDILPLVRCFGHGRVFHAVSFCGRLVLPHQVRAPSIARPSRLQTNGHFGRSFNSGDWAGAFSLTDIAPRPHYRAGFQSTMTGKGKSDVIHDADLRFVPAFSRFNADGQFRCRTPAFLH